MIRSIIRYIRYLKSKILFLFFSIIHFFSLFLKEKALTTPKYHFKTSNTVNSTNCIIQMIKLLDLPKEVKNRILYFLKKPDWKHAVQCQNNGKHVPLPTSLKV